MPESGAPQQGQLAIRLQHDQQQCWRCGEQVVVEAYLQQHPSLEADEGAVLDLIYSEILLREEAGERPSLAEYLQRFPQHAAQLRRQFLVHQALVTSQPEPLDESHAAPPRAVTTPLADLPREVAAETLTSQTSAPRVPNVRVEGYEILEEVGRGGMGVVYKARQASLNRVVALKMVLAGEHSGVQEAARFRAEAEAVASLQHPNVVQIHAVGLHEGRPFLALEFVDGTSLAEYINGTPQPPAFAAQLVATLAYATHAGHRHGIVHRDLKPANILLACDERRGADAADVRPDVLAGVHEQPLHYEPKITDFGLAKRLESDSHLTQTGDILGTPSYMAPEQARGSTHDVGPSVDIYALGAILYELLTGRPPFRGTSALDTLHQVRFDEPVPPSRLQPKLPRDLVTICLKCLEKRSNKRYPTAESLALDLQRFLAGKSIEARRVPTWERLWKWAKRRPTAAALIAVTGGAAVTLLAVWVQFTSQLRVERNQAQTDRREALRQRANADFQRDRAEQHLYDAQTNLAQQAWRSAHIARLLELLEAHVPAPGEADLRGPEWYYLSRLAHSDLLTLRGHTSFVRHVALSPDGRLLASAGDDEVVKVWDATTGAELDTLRGHASFVNAVAFDPDSGKLASAGGDHTVKVWDVADGAKLCTLRGHSAPVCSVTFSPDGHAIASASRDGTVAVWDVRRGTRHAVLRGHRGAVFATVYDSQGRRLISGSEDKTVRIWDLETEQAARVLDAGAPVLDVALSPDDAYLATGGDENLVRIWDAKTGQIVQTLRGHTGTVTAVAFDANGQRLASSSRDRTARVWELPTGRQTRVFRGHLRPVRAIAFHPDGRRLASASRAVKVWDTTTEQQSRPLQGHSGPVHCAVFSPDGTLLASAGHDQAVRIWDQAKGRELAVLRGHKGPVTCVAFSPDGESIASAGQDRTVKIWPVEDGEPPVTLNGHTGMINSVAFSPDGRLLASGSRDQTIRIWDRTTAAPLHVIPSHAAFVRTVQFSPDGRLLAAGDWNGAVTLWDPATGHQLRELGGHDKSVECVAFNPNATRLASAGKDGLVKIWNTQSGAEVHVLRGHTWAIAGVAFASDGRRLISGGGSPGQSGELMLWNVVTGQELLTMSGHSDEVTSVALSPDRQHWMSASRDQTVRIWDAPVSGQP